MNWKQANPLLVEAHLFKLRWPIRLRCSWTEGLRLLVGGRVWFSVRDSPPWPRRGDCAGGAVGAVDQCRKYLIKIRCASRKSIRMLRDVEPTAPPAPSAPGCPALTKAGNAAHRITVCVQPI